MMGMRAVAGVVLTVVGLLMCAVDVGRRIAHRERYGGMIQAIWGPDQAPVIFYLGLAVLVGGSVVLFGTASP